jgi:drug/metabolite transporter (DMT)-like permease
MAIARLQVVGAAALFSTAGAVIKGTQLTSWQVAGWRSLIAAGALLLLMPHARRHWHGPNVVVGIVYAATLVLFVTANKLTTAADAIFLQATGPLYILLLAPWVLGEHTSRRDLAFMAAIAIGLVLVFMSTVRSTASAPDPHAGQIVGAASGLTWGLTVMGLRWIGRRDADVTINTVVIGNLVAACVCLPLASGDPPSVRDWLALLWLGVFQIALAYVLLSAAVHRVTALEASLLLLAEPVLNPIWAWLVHRERPGASALAGGALILIATAVRTMTERGQQPAAALE